MASLFRHSLRLRNAHSLLARSLTTQNFNNFQRKLPTLTVQKSLPYSTSGTQEPDSTSEKSTKTHEFRAQTKRLLDIVARSLYSDKEIFIRELISNASDALEKVRYLQMSQNNVIGEENTPLEIRLYTDEKNQTFTIQDTGIGMTEKDAIQNLGTIAHSGSKEFLEKFELGKGKPGGENIIGQFGVGFYSSFMVGEKVHVYSKSAIEGDGIEWTSEGGESFEISESKEAKRGTKIVISLRDSCKEFAKEKIITSIIKKYSNFVSFPIYVNDVQVNTIKPLWVLPKDQISEDDHNDFYKFISGASDPPSFHLYYNTDSPISIRALLYTPSFNPEKLGVVDRMESSINLYSRRVLIQAKSKQLLPEWLRFVSGVCDSEDIPLNLSRELLQDHSLIAKIRSTLTNRILRWFQEISQKDPAKYLTFFREFSSLFEEGVASDFDHKEKIAQLLRYESSSSGPNEEISLDEYITRCKPDQKKIYYIVGPSRDIVQSSPYMEQFLDKKIEVMYFYKPVLEFVFRSLRTYKGYELVSVESEALELDQTQKKKKDENQKEYKDFTKWVKSVLKDQVTDVTLSNRLISHPAMIGEKQSIMIQQMVNMMENKKSEATPFLLEINPNHPVIKKLETVRKKDPLLSEMVIQQIFENAKLASGFMPDTKSSIERWNVLLEKTLVDDIEIVSSSDTQSNHSEDDVKETKKE